MAGGAASQMQLGSPERADCRGPWVRAPSGGRAALKLREEVSGSPCRAAPALHSQGLLVKSAPAVCIHRSVPGGLLVRATKVVGLLSLRSCGVVRGHRWDEDSVSPGVDSRIQAGFSLQAGLTHSGLHLTSPSLGPRSTFFLLPSSDCL